MVHTITEEALHEQGRPELGVYAYDGPTGWKLDTVDPLEAVTQRSRVRENESDDAPAVVVEKLVGAGFGA